MLVFPAGSKAFSSPTVFLLFEKSFLLSVCLTTDRKAFRLSLQLFSIKTELDGDSDNGNATALWPEELRLHTWEKDVLILYSGMSGCSAKTTFPTFR